MYNERSLYSLFESGGISRRHFLKRTGYTGLAALGVGSVFSACGALVTAKDTTPAPILVFFIFTQRALTESLATTSLKR